MSVRREIKGMARGFARSERGTQILELAFVLPLLFLLFASVTELGRYFYTYSTLVNATSVGSRYLSTATLVNGDYSTADKTAAKNLVLCGNAAGCGGTDQPALRLSDLKDSNISVVLDVAVISNKKVTVAIMGYSYTPIFDLGAMLHDDTLNLGVEMKPSTTMRYMQ